MNLKLIICAAITSFVFPLQTTQAATVVFNKADDVWNNTANWSPAGLPTTADTAFINTDRIANVNSAVATTSGSVIVGNQPANAGTLNVNAGGSLTVDSGGGAVFTLNNTTGNGTLNVQGGSLTAFNNTGSQIVFRGESANPASSVFNLTSGTFTAQGSAGSDSRFINSTTMNLSGGTLDMTGGQVIPQGNSVFNILGSAASITMDRLNMVSAARASDWNFTFDSTGISTVQSANFLHLAYANINVDGSAYMGGAGSFDLFSSGNLATTPVAAPTITGAFPGFDSAIGQVGNNYVMTLTPLPPPPPTPTEALLSVFPTSSQAPLSPGNWTYSQTNNVDLSGSTWEPGLDENDVYHSALKHDQLVGTASQDWEIRIGKGGHIYSIRSEVGEIVPPQVRVTNPGFSPWNDEVFQSVSVDTYANSGDNKYFYHQSGYYVDGATVTEPTYSPMLASADVGDDAYSTLSLAVQPKATQPQQPSGVLNWQRTKDLGDGVVEVTYLMYNFGNHKLNFHNMPWGGSRDSVFGHMLVSDPGGGFTDEVVLPWGGGESQTIDTSATDGWVAFAEGANPTDRAMALVIGDTDTQIGQPWQTRASDWRWGGTGVERDFLVGTLRRHVDVDPGDVFYSRYYMVFGEVGDIESIINAQNLSDDATYDKLTFAEGSVDQLSWRVVESGGVVSVEETTAANSHFKTFGQPVNGSKPLFLLEDDQGNEFISINPYSLSNFPYDGATVYKGLLGFVLPAAQATGPGPYLDLAALFPAGNAYYLDPDLANFALAGAVVQGLEADFNGDDVVDASDLAAWQLALGNGAGADADADGDSDGADFLIWQRQIGNSLPASAVAVPEPAGVVLILGAFVTISFTRL